MQKQKLTQFMDHRAVMFSDRTYTGPIHAETKHQESMKNKLAEGTIPASKLTRANIVGYGTTKKVEAPKPNMEAQDDDVEIDFGGDSQRKLNLRGVETNPKKRTFDSFLQKHGGQTTEDVQKRRKLNP